MLFAFAGHQDDKDKQTHVPLDFLPSEKMTDEHFQDNAFVGMEEHNHHHQEAAATITATETTTTLSPSSTNHHPLAAYQEDDVGWREIVQGVVEEGVVEHHHHHPEVEAAAAAAAAASAVQEEQQESLAVEPNYHKRQFQQSATNTSLLQKQEQDEQQAHPPIKRPRTEAEEAATDITVDVTDPAALSRAMIPFITTYSKKVNNEQWDAMFARLVAYKEHNGDCLVPKRYPADPKLGTWVETQRVQYKRLARDSFGVAQPNKRLNRERLQKLESIGFAWTAKGRKVVKAPRSTATSTTSTTNASNRSTNSEGERAKNRSSDAQWEEMYQRLVKYKEVYGDTLVPRKYDKDPRLASWVETQRAIWNRDYRESTAAEQQTNGAIALPESAAVPPMAAAAAAKDNESEEEWPTGTLAEDVSNTQHHHGGATDEEGAAVAAATMAEAEDPDAMIIQDDEVVAAAAAAGVEALDYLHQETIDMTKLPAAPPKQRLSAERKAKLDDLGFVWSLRNKRIDDHWDEMFRQLVQYKEKHGDCLVPSRYEENLRLGKWVETQRYEYTKLRRAAAQTEEVPKEHSDTTAEPNAAAASALAAKRLTSPRLTEERIRRLEAIGFEWKVKHKMKRYYEKIWDQMFQRLLQFKEENGHCLVPKRYPADIKLGTWVHTQRIQYRKMTGTVSARSSEAGSDEEFIMDKPEDEVSYRLTDERRRRLDEIGFVWNVKENERANEQNRVARNSYDDQWDQMFDQLRVYKEQHGHCLVPKRYAENRKLGTWVDTQRVQYKKMMRKVTSDGNVSEGGQRDDSSSGGGPAMPVIGRLTHDRIRRLEELGFVWSLRDDWYKHYEELKAFKREHGHCNVPARYQNNRRLGIFVSAQRQQYKALQQGNQAKNSRLTQDRISLLNELGFTWTIRSRDSLGESWNQRLQELKDYKAIHGNCLVPSRYPDNPELGVWCGTQRTQYRMYMKNKEEGNPTGYTAMTEDRIQQLEEIGFVWALRTGDKKDASDPLDGDGLASAIDASHPIQGDVHENIVREVADDAILRTVMEHHI